MRVVTADFEAFRRAGFGLTETGANCGRFSVVFWFRPGIASSKPRSRGRPIAARRLARRHPAPAHRDEWEALRFAWRVGAMSSRTP